MYEKLGAHQDFQLLLHQLINYRVFSLATASRNTGYGVQQ
jgi:hypothetical protein